MPIASTLLEGIVVDAKLDSLVMGSNALVSEV